MNTELRWSWMLSIPRGVHAELKMVGEHISKNDIVRLRKQIDFLIESWEADETPATEQGWEHSEKPPVQKP